MMVIEGSVGIDNESIVAKYTSRLPIVAVLTAACRLLAWSRTMKTIVAGFLGLVALVMSFPGGSPVYADALETESSALAILAPDAGASGVESPDQQHCVLYSDGADNCIVNAQPEVVDQRSAAADEVDPPAAEEAPAIRFVDAIPVVVVQTVTIAAPGLDAGDREEAASTQPMPAPATEPASDVDGRATTGALSPPAGQSADAIVVAIVQSVTIAVPGQSAGDSEETAQVESMSGPPAPISIRQAETTALDDLE
jgi:hypothetical protein